ncbi:hypothetical protein LEP1GSC052_2461 [Leptospira kmetyi serovar Malaysia str. Bejo-Iso9]|nr:hypothetical protein LEP1GSC052_2461 [Leptospira kmetyi serovar Malaysia str. Bejo-Iso9]
MISAVSTMFIRLFRLKRKVETVLGIVPGSFGFFSETVGTLTF